MATILASERLDLPGKYIGWRKKEKSFFKNNGKK
jgi:hypothetical protein